jgi:hypothetical protein
VSLCTLQAEKRTETNLLSTLNDDPSTQLLTAFPLLDISPISPFPFFLPQESKIMTDRLIHAVVSSDLPFLNSLLYPSPSSPSINICSNQCPVLVNKPDGNGWSAIHHCVATKRLSTEVLDALYYAGADVSLFTTSEHYTPLHCLARRGHTSTPSLYLFTVRLVHDLHAPLNAKDKNEETCIHIAAEHGECIDVLMAFLDCDKTCTVRDSRNLRGYVVTTHRDRMLLLLSFLPVSPLWK